jgi:hypothetical protein
MVNKFKGWQRFGIVASVVWLVGSFMFFLGRATEVGVTAASSIYAMCVAAVPRVKDCSAELTRNVQLFTSNRWAEATINAVVPLLLIWLFIYIAMRVNRSIAAGRLSIVERN